MDWFKNSKYEHDKKKWAKKSLKVGFKKKFDLGLKEEFYFASGLMLGAIFGFIGNFFATIYFKWVDEGLPDEIFYPILLIFVIAMSFFIGWWLKTIRKMKKKYLSEVMGSPEWNLVYGKKYYKKHYRHKK